MPTIKLIDVRMMVLRAAMKKEEQRLQDVADQVARISAGLDMELRSSAGIEEILTKLRNNLKKQSGNWTVMQQLAQQASADLHQKDEELAQKARGLNYSARQFVQSASSALTGKLVQNVAEPFLGLSALNKLGLTQSLGDLFDGVGSGFGDALQGVSLGELVQGGLSTLEDYSTAGNHDASPGFLGDLATAAVATALGGGAVGAAGIAGLAGLASLLDKKSTASSGTSSGPAVLGATATTGRNIDIDLSKEALKNIMRTVGKASVDAVSSVPQKIGEAKVAAEGWVDQKQEEYDAYIAQQELEAQRLTEATGREYSVDIFGNVYDVEEHEEEMEERRKEREERLANRSIFEKAGDALSDWGDSAWETMVEIAESKPVEYIGEIGGDIISGGADLASFCGNLVTLNWADAAADGYSFINGFYETAQDGDALLTYGFGGVFDALGMQDKADEYYAEAEVKAGREGLADELHASGFDTAGTIVDGVDWGVGVYKTVTGIGKLDQALDNMEWNSLGETGKNLLSLSGWKNVDALSETAELGEQIKHYKDTASNVKLGYKYLDGLFSDGLGGLGWTAVTNTSPGKTGTGIVGGAQGFLDLIESAATANDN